MASKILTEIQHVCEFKPLPSNEEIEAWVAAALTDRVPELAEVCIRIVDKDEIQALNQQYRAKNKPTNVLSFPVDFPEEVALPLLGDIVVCAPVVFEEAQTQNKIYEHHFAHMIVHGCLHLLGYDHVTDEQAGLMEPLEISILAAIDIPNPYNRETT